MPTTARSASRVAEASIELVAGDDRLARRRTRRTRPTSISTNVTAAKTPSFAASTGSRRGTAIRLERIIPVEYSPLITSTPEDADRELREVVAADADVDRVERARSPAPSRAPAVHLTAATSTPRPTIGDDGVSSDQRVERSDHSFVHSERSDARWVTAAAETPGLVGGERSLMRPLQRAAWRGLVRNSTASPVRPM